MMRPLLSSLAMIANACLVLAAPAQARSTSGPEVVFRNVTVVPMTTERIIPNQTVIVRGLTIESVGPVENTHAPRGAVVIDSPRLFNGPGFSILREMQLMSEAGMTPYEILRSGTEQAGEYTKRPCGTITIGACADLILLNDNPLRDVRNVGRQAGVMVRGRWLPIEEIRHRLKSIVEIRPTTV